ncbi:MAG: TIGR03790 family protein [Opitutales bacterium]|jgi:uncharacterized protein (TIGR03790 family)
MLLFLKRTAPVFLAALLPVASISHGQGEAPGPDSVVVVANSSMEGSLEVARAYMERRGIPDKNLVVLETSVEEHIPRPLYLETIHNPLLQALLDRRLIDAFEGTVDDLGRKTATVFSNPIRYLVLCYGIPTRVKPIPNEMAQTDEPLLQKQFRRGAPVLLMQFSQGNLSRNEASVDGELALLLKRDIPLRGFFPNPLHKQSNPGRHQDILRVCRLDGPSPKAVIGMIDSALAGEQEGLRGRAYVDEDARKNAYALGNEWMARTAELFKGLGYDTSHETRRATFKATDRFDAPVLYAGWYAPNRNGPFVLPGFRFPVGAVAAHLHSFSAVEVRSTHKGWVGPLVDKGVSATFGNVAEPYLTLTHHFDLFFQALADGWNFGDAAYYALPGLSWQCISVGDPLYRPFRVGLEEQAATVGSPQSILEDQYVLIRQINQLKAEGETDAAFRLASRGMRDTPGPALALTRARLYEDVGNTEKALSCLSLASQVPLDNSLDWGLFAEIADALTKLGDPAAGLDIYRKLEKKSMPEAIKLAFLKRGIPVAQAAGDPGLAIEWAARTTPPPGKKPAEANKK